MMGIAEVKANLIDHIGKIDLEKLTIAELREYCGLVKDADGLTGPTDTDRLSSIMGNLCMGFGHPAPVKEG